MKLLCIGDSLTYGYMVKRSDTWTELIQKKTGFKTVNRGICGDSTVGILSRLDREIRELKPDAAIVMGGANDFIWNVPISIVKSSLSTSIYHLMHNGIVPYLGVPIPIEREGAKLSWPIVKDIERINNDIRELRKWIIEFSGYNKIGVIDFYSHFTIDNNPILENYMDGLHPNIKGHMLMADIAALRLTNPL